MEHHPRNHLTNIYELITQKLLKYILFLPKNDNYRSIYNFASALAMELQEYVQNPGQIETLA